VKSGEFHFPNAFFGNSTPKQRLNGPVFGIARRSRFSKKFHLYWKLLIKAGSFSFMMEIFDKTREVCYNYQHD